MAVEAYVHHHIPGRLRMRVPSAKGENEVLRELSSAIATVSGVSEVEYNPVTGSILIQYSPAQHQTLESLDAGLNASSVPIIVRKTTPARHSSGSANSKYRRQSVAAEKVNAFFKRLDLDIRSATDNEVDLKFILPFLVSILGVLAVRRSSATPLWLTLLIFAFHSFLGLNVEAIDELSAADGSGD
ncbi:MAG TPA: hypothetical protein VJN94_16000 [Candidatus Binataceae bacterium]|nr:hypothetical protein [Candidatus Binataceae bacterium]